MLLFMDMFLSKNCYKDFLVFFEVLTQQISFIYLTFPKIQTLCDNVEHIDSCSKNKGH